MKSRSCRRPSGAPSGSASTGMSPLPCLPVDSAISCSSQAPKSAIAGEAMMVTLSRPVRAAACPVRPERDARIVGRRHVGGAGAHHQLRGAQEAPTSRPIAAAGTRPKSDSTE